MKKLYFALLIFAIILAGCAKYPEVTVAPTDTPTATSTPTETATPTVTSTPTNTPMATSTPSPTPTPIDWSDTRQYVDDSHGMIKAELRDKLTAINVYKKNVDEEASKKIEQRLTEIEEDIKSGKLYPNLSGFKLYEAKAVKKELDVDFCQSFFVEGILSGYFAVRYKFYDSLEAGCGNYWNSYEYMYPVTFNLESGEEIKIRDLFYNDVDYLKYLKDTAMKRIFEAEIGAYEALYIYYGDAQATKVTLSELEWLQILSDISENQRFTIDNGQLVLLFDQGEKQIGVNIAPTKDFFDNATYHIVHLDNPYLVEAPADNMFYQVKIVDKDYDIVDVSYENITPVKLKNGEVVSFKMQDISEKWFSISDIKEMLQDKSSQLYKNIYEMYTENGVAYVDQFELDKYVVLMAYSYYEWYHTVEFAVYTFFDKETLQPLQICLVSDKPETFFKQGKDYVKILKNEIESAIKNDKKKKSYYSTDKKMTNDISNCVNNLQYIFISPDGKINCVFGGGSGYVSNDDAPYSTLIALHLYADHFGLETEEFVWNRFLKVPFIFSNPDDLSF